MVVLNLLDRDAALALHLPYQNVGTSGVFGLLRLDNGKGAGHSVVGGVSCENGWHVGHTLAGHRGHPSPRGVFDWPCWLTEVIGKIGPVFCERMWAEIDDVMRALGGSVRAEGVEAVDKATDIIRGLGIGARAGLILFCSFLEEVAHPIERLDHYMPPVEFVLSIEEPDQHFLVMRYLFETGSSRALGEWVVVTRLAQYQGDGRCGHAICRRPAVVSRPPAHTERPVR